MIPRFTFFLLAAFTLSIPALAADDNIRAAQERLKQGGFYFGQPDGRYDSDTAAAVTRYQIRNGLPISGQLDAETARALGVSAPAGAGAPSASQTWQRLRKSDEQFLTRLNRGQVAPPTPPAPQTPAPKRREPVPPPRATPQSAPPPAAPLPGESTLVLSRERLRDYIAAFVLAGLDPRVGSELEFFAGKVNYYGKPSVPRERIRRDLVRYNEKWPARRFWLAGDLDVRPFPDGRIRVTFPLRYELRNGSNRASGRIRKTLVLEVRGQDLVIVSVDEKKA